MERFILLLAMITHLNMVNGISMLQKSSMPTVTVTPSSTSIQVSWAKISSWSSSSVFTVSISIPDSVITEEFICDGGPGTECVLDTEDFSEMLLPACTPVAVTVEASGVVVGPRITTTLSPDPLELSVVANERNLYIKWELPKSCEKSSKLIIRARDVILHEEVFSVPESSHTYELNDDISACEMLQVLVKTVTTDGESKGLKNTFLYAEPKGLSVNKLNSSIISVTWENPSCILKTEVSWYDTSYSPPHLIGRDEVAATSYQVPTESELNLTLCVKPRGHFGTQWLDGEEICTDVSEFSESRSLNGVPDLIITPHKTSVDVTFTRIAPWTDVEDYILVLHKGTDHTGDGLCSYNFTCTKPVCQIKSDEHCDPLPSCTDIFVEVLGYSEVMTGSTKTLCETTTMSTTSSTETTSATKSTSTASSTVSPPSTFTTNDPDTPTSTISTAESTSTMKSTSTGSTTVTESTITESTSTTKSTSTGSTTVTASTTTAVTNTQTSTTPITTKSTSTTATPTTTIPSGPVPDLTLTPYMTSIDVLFFRLAPWNYIRHYTLVIHNGADNTGDELCNNDITCNTPACNIKSDDYCGPLPSCTDVFVEVLGYIDPMTGSTKTLCEPRTSTTTVSTDKTTSSTKPISTDKTSSSTKPISTVTPPATTNVTYTTGTFGSTTDDTTPKPKDNTALIVGLSVGIPVALIVIAGVAYIIKIKCFGQTVMEVASLRL